MKTILLPTFKTKAHLRIGFALLAFFLTACQGNLNDAQEIESIKDKDAIFGGATIDDKSNEKLTVGIKFKDGNGNFQICSGSWISSDWIVTAAHCLPSKVEDLAIYEHTAIEDSESTLKVAEMIPHPLAAAEKKRLVEEKNWVQANRYDIALIRVEAATAPQDHWFFNIADSVDFERDPGERLLPSAKASFFLLTAGYGAQQYDVLTGVHNNERTLRMIFVTVPNIVTNGIIRVSQDGPKGVCVGDSGAPLFRFYKSTAELLGVASSVRNPGSSSICNGESRFVQIGQHKSWIASVMNDLKN